MKYVGDKSPSDLPSVQINPYSKCKKIKQIRANCKDEKIVIVSYLYFHAYLYAANQFLKWN